MPRKKTAVTAVEEIKAESAKVEESVVAEKAETAEPAAPAKRTRKPAAKKTAARVETKAEAPATEAPLEKAAKEIVKPAKEEKAEAAAPKKTRKPAAKKSAAKAEAKPAAKAETPAANEAEASVEAPAKPVKKTRKPAAKKVKEAVEVKETVEAVPADDAQAAPVVETVAAHVAETVVEPVKETVAEPAAEAVAESLAEVAVQPAAEAVAETATETEPVAEPAKEAETEAETAAEPSVEAEPVAAVEVELPQPRRSVAFIGSECYPFVKTGGLGDVMYALPRALIKQNCDVKVILPRYKCIPWKYQEKMVYRGAFQMDLCADGRSFYVGIMEYVCDGVVYDFIDNEDFFGYGNPYTNLVDDIPRYCYFAKAALAALNYMDWVPDVIHCHDWQAALVPVYLRTLFANTPIGDAKTMLTIHNLRFQGIYNIPTIQYWSGLPGYVFNKDAMTQNWLDANMLKGGLTYCDMITTVSNTYAGEIQTPFFGENLDAHLRYHSGKLRGIVNGIDVDLWNPATDDKLAANYDLSSVLKQKKADKRAMQAQLGLDQDDHKFVIGLISRLTDQKGLDLVNAILPSLVDGHTQVVVLGTGDARYENSFRYYEEAYRGSVCSNIMYDEARAHAIYAGADALLVPSLFEPCGLTQLIAMRYGTIPIVRETGGLKDTVQPYNQFTNWGNGFTFDRYDAGLLLDAVNRAKTLYFTNRWCWDEMVQRDMDTDVSWDSSAKQYRALYLELKP